jgi:predicted nucleic acid-binding protein
VAELLVDTDVFIDHLRGARELKVGRDSLSYSVITRCELFAGASADEQVIGRLLSPFRELAVDRAVAESAGRIRRETGVRTPDALIAATALRFGLMLMTRNASDFARVPELRSHLRRGR